MAELRWFHVVLTEAGDLVSCREVAKAGDRIFVFRARSAEAAIRQAINAHSAKQLANRRAIYRAQGLCACGRKRENKNFVTCQRCLERHKIHDRRHEAKTAGAVLPPLDRRTVLQERKSEERVTILQEVLDAWQSEPTNGAFTAWLLREIERAGGKRRAS